MKVLWITNILLPPVCIELGIKPAPFGGWMMSSLKELMSQFDIEFGIATIHDNDEFKEYNLDGVKYYLIPSRFNIEYYDSSIEKYWKSINDDFKPDVVHIHGSEYQHGHAYIKACGNERVVLSIQGLISVYARYVDGGIENFGRSIWYPLDCLRGYTIRSTVKQWRKRAEGERRFLCNLRFLIGRTEWDKVHSWAINPTAKYFFCGETMREIFYHQKWSYENCEPHTIFISQGQYTIKGLHQLIKAIPLIKRVYPDVKVRIAGTNVLREGWRKSGYKLYLSRLIEKTNSSSTLEFVGKLDEQQMCEQFLNANVFVCPSAIENSSNSIGEAQLLGMPIIASYVGGNAELLGYSKDSLYRFEEYEMLAEKIINVFHARGNVSPKYDLERYDPIKNAHTLVSIYHQIANGV